MDQTLVHKVYVGNLPHHCTEQALKEVFSICGKIKYTEVIKYDDHNDGPRAYGFVNFETRQGVEKALLFHLAHYEGLALKVYDANKTQYSTYLGGIPAHITKELIIAEVEQLYPGKVYSDSVNYIAAGSSAYVFISFRDDETRYKFCALTNPFSSKMSPKLREAKKVMATALMYEGDYEAIVKKVPTGISNHIIRTLFMLCGPIKGTPKVNDSENYFTTAFITFTTKAAFDKALSFHRSDVNGLPIPIEIMPKATKYVASQEYPFSATIKNFGKELTLKDIEIKLTECGLGLDDVRCVKNKHDQIFANFKEEKKLDKILSISGNLYLGGHQPALIERTQHKQTGAGSTSHQPAPSLILPGSSQTVKVTLETTLGTTVIVKRFSEIGSIDKFNTGPNSYTFELSLKL